MLNPTKEEHLPVLHSNFKHPVLPATLDVVESVAMTNGLLRGTLHWQSISLLGKSCEGSLKGKKYFFFTLNKILIIIK